MDHNLGDSLNLDAAMGVDFEHAEDTVTSQTDITLEDSGHGVGIPMEFEQIEEQPMLMDTGSEEIIDFMGEQFTLQEYTEHEDQSTILSTTGDSNQNTTITSQADTIIEMETKPQRIINEDHTLPKIVAVKTALSSNLTAEVKKSEPEVYTSAPRQVAIAPKPPVLIQTSKAYVPGKQFAIAPKPVALVSSKSNSFLKKVTLASVMQGNTKGNTVLTQIGKQLVVMPVAGAQKLKLVSTSSGVSTGSGVPTVQYIRANAGEKGQLIQAKNISTQHNKPVMTKLIVQGQANVEVNGQQTVITKVTPVSSTKSPTRYVTMQQKTVPFTIGNKVLLASPTKSGVKFAKKQQIIAFKSPEKNSQANQGSTTKKVVITSNPSQNVILKTTAPPKTAQITKDGNIVVEGQRTQLHQINVPGKGIQYIRLITNSASASTKPKHQPQTINVPSKTFVLTDNKGNLIQMSAEKMVSTGQPPPLVVTGNTTSLNKLTVKPQQKLVKIAPLVPKSAQSIVTSRSSQSLLAPLLPMSEVSQSTTSDIVSKETEEMDSKAALRALVAEVMRDEAQSDTQTDAQPEGEHTDTRDMIVSVDEVEVEFKRDCYSDGDENNDSMDQHDSSGRSEEHPLIVIPSNYLKETNSMNLSDNQSAHEDSQKMNSLLSVDADLLNAYQSPRTPQALSETEMVSTELGLRPRKACNCTKSQCLKLYCDCFANGEFCNRCNCNNCHNNLENEELRQKAIRGCLDRNPNAFRPKIGKAKIGGPEIVRRHNKGCNCKRSGCLKNYCECYEAKIACTSICKCVGCRNVEETLERSRRRDPPPPTVTNQLYRPPPPPQLKQPCSFMTTEVIEAVCQCLLAAGGEGCEEAGGEGRAEAGVDPTRDVIEEFARCLQDIISAAQHSSPLTLLDESPA